MIVAVLADYMLLNHLLPLRNPRIWARYVYLAYPNVRNFGGSVQKDFCSRLLVTSDGINNIRTILYGKLVNITFFSYSGKLWVRLSDLVRWVIWQCFNEAPLMRCDVLLRGLFESSLYFFAGIISDKRSRFCYVCVYGFLCEHTLFIGIILDLPKI